jgi:hypothetical protein
MLLLCACLHVVSCVERLQVKLPAGLGCPETQVDAVARLETGDGRVISHSCHLHSQPVAPQTISVASRCTAGLSDWLADGLQALLLTNTHLAHTADGPALAPVTAAVDSSL